MLPSQFPKTCLSMRLNLHALFLSPSHHAQKRLRACHSSSTKKYFVFLFAFAWQSYSLAFCSRVRTVLCCNGHIANNYRDWDALTHKQIHENTGLVPGAGTMHIG
jgi:hypothetical protein